jgi:hypothetical protein
MSELNVLDGMLNALESLHDETRNIVNKYDNRPLPGSQAETEFATPLSAPSGILIPPEFQLTNAFTQSNMLFVSAAEHLIAVKRVLTVDVLTIAPWTCLRALIESCALACWLLDPSETAEKRIGKSFAYRFKDLSQSKAIANSMGDNVGAQKAEARIEEIERAAVLRGYVPLVKSNGKRNGIGEKMPELTNLVRDMLNEETVYRMSSGIIHGNMSPLRLLGFQKSNIPQVQYGVNVETYEKFTSISMIKYICQKAAISFIKPTWFKSKLYGWNQAELSAIFETTANALSIDPTQCFWRSPSNP